MNWQPGERPKKTASGWRTIHDRLVDATPGFKDMDHWSQKDRIAQRLVVLRSHPDIGGAGLSYEAVREALSVAPKFTSARVGTRIGYSVKGIATTDDGPATWVDYELYSLAVR